MKKQQTNKTETIKISAPKFDVFKIKIRGVSPYLSNRFQKRDWFIEKYESDEPKNKKKNKEARDFDKEWPKSVHWARQKWAGLPAAAFRNGMINACRLINYKMTLAKLSLFVEADGFDSEFGDPLVKITKGKFKKHVAITRNADGSPNVIARGILDEGWEAELCIRIDSDQFTRQDAINLLSRVGYQVGIGAGRHNSKTSNGIGMGMFEVVTKKSRK